MAVFDVQALSFSNANRGGRSTWRASSSAEQQGRWITRELQTGREREGESCNKRPTHRHLSLSLSLNIYVYIKERNTGFTDGGVDGRTSIFALLLRLLLPFVCMYVCDDCGFGKARAHMYTSQRISRTHHACVSRI